MTEIVRDLKVCELVSQEQDILRIYNGGLTAQLDTEVKRRIAAETSSNQYKLTTIRQSKVITALIVVVITQAMLKILSR